MDAEAQLDGFIDKYEPHVAAMFRGALTRLKLLVPGAVLLAYDNYNALAVGFAPREKASAAVLSVAAYPRWVTLFFLKGAGLADPDGLLEGAGSTVRSIRLDDELSQLDDPRVLALIAETLERCEPPFDPQAGQQLVIRSISDTQRPRRPAEPGARARRLASTSGDRT
jgi:hypothetical protein